MDLLNQDNLRNIIDEIESDENKLRKAEHEKRFQVYSDYQRDYVLKMLTNEFSPQTVREMRTCTSINLTKRIVSEMASIYKRKPHREVMNASEAQEEGIELLYDAAKVDTFLKRANQKYKLHEQCAIQVLPKNGMIALKLLAPHQYDVIPMADDPESAFAYVISSYDKTWTEAAHSGNQDIQGHYYGSKNTQQSNQTNEKIADDDDWRVQKRYVIWTAEMNIVCDGNGNILEANPNPIEMLPFIDVASEKDFEFWVRRGSGVTEFNLDFSVVLSDTCNTNRLQSYAQPVIVAEKVPENVSVGPQNILFLPLDPTRPEVRPSFDFASPNPDLKASLDLQDRLLSYFLTANGISPKTISGDGSSEKFTSGVERLLAMIERFEASQSDIDLFLNVEQQLFQLIGAWYSIIQGTDALNQKYNFGMWPVDGELNVKFMGPEITQTETDKEDSVIKRLDAGLISRVEAIAELRGIPLEDAREIVAQMDAPLETI
jgi:hypothetical protein